MKNEGCPVPRVVTDQDRVDEEAGGEEGVRLTSESERFLTVDVSDSPSPSET